MDIRAQIREFVISNFVLKEGPDSLRDDDSFMEKGIIDSTGILELVGFIEETFPIQMEDSELVPENLGSVNQVVSYIHRKMGYAA